MLVQQVKSNHATEGKIVGICEDNVPSVNVDKSDYMTSENEIEKLGHNLHMVIATGNISKRISHSTSRAETLSCAALILWVNWLPCVLQSLNLP